MTTYDEAKSKVFVRGSVPEGYFGERANVGFCLIGKQIYTVADCGYYRTGMPDCLDEAEALWILQNHPWAKNIKLAAQYSKREYAEIREAFLEDDSIELSRAEREDAPQYVLDEWADAVGGLTAIRSE